MSGFENDCPNPDNAQEERLSPIPHRQTGANTCRDRGVQYCAKEYVDLLKAHGFQISMSRTGNPYDNAVAESFMRTLKCEEVYLNSYRDRDDALLRIEDFLERIYNCERLHSTLGYLTPAAYEAEVCKQNREISA
jgi:transposase InsO family protein